MTPREADHAMRGAATRDQHLIRAAQAVAYSVAVLTGSAINNPKKMPSFDKAFPDKAAGSPKVQTEAETAANLNAWTSAINAYHQSRNPEKVMQ